MDMFIGIVVLVVVLSVVAYFKIPKVKAYVDGKLSKTKENLLDSIKGPAKPSDDVLATPVPTPVKESPVALPSGSQTHITSMSQVTDQATLDKYRTYLFDTNRGLLAYTPTVYKAPDFEAEHVGTVDSKPKPFPETWDGKHMRQVVELKVGTNYLMSFMASGLPTAGVSISPVSSEEGNAHISTMLQKGVEEPVAVGGAGKFKNVPFTKLTGGVLYTVWIKTDKDCKVWLQVQ
jgi:hypothetical protein